MTCGVVVVARDGEEYLEACLRALITQTDPPRRLLVIDQGSRDRSLKIIRSLESEARQRGISMSVIEQQHTGYTSGANHGLEWLQDSGEDLHFAVLLNQAAILEPGWCRAIGTAFEADGRTGAVGSRILSPNRLTIQHAGGYVETPRLVAHHNGHHMTDVPGDFMTSREVEYVTAAVIAMRLSTLREIGLFDKTYSPRYYEDVDWCARARGAGWKVVYEPLAVATQLGPPLFRLTPERLNLFHRNRLIYALPRLANESFRREFAAAERQHINGHVSDEDRRAIAVAYLWIILMLPELAAMGRTSGREESPDMLSDLIEFFGNLRRELTRG